MTWEKEKKEKNAGRMKANRKVETFAVILILIFSKPNNNMMMFYFYSNTT